MPQTLIIKYLPHLALIALAVGAFFLVRADAHQDGVQACQHKQLSADAQGVRTNASKTTEIKRLDDADLDRRLRRWVQR